MEIQSIFQLILLFGAAFIFLLSLYLLFYPVKFYANKVLGLLAFSWAITVFVFVIQSKDFFEKFPHLYASVDIFTLLFFPLMFIYIKSYLYKDARDVSDLLIHFIPAAIYILVFSPFLFKSGAEKIDIMSQGMPDWYYQYQNIFNLVIIAQGIFYTILSLRTLHHFQYFRQNKLSKLQLSSLKWLRIFVFINVVLWIIGATGAILGIIGIQVPIDVFYLFYFGLTILTFFLGIFTIMRPQFFGMSQDISSLSSAGASTASSPPNGSFAEEFGILQDYFQNERPYLKNDLQMQDLVEGTGLSYKKISETLNNEFNQSFFDVVNDYRTKAAIHLIDDGFHEQHTLVHLAEQAGFNSKTTFNRIFKKHTGQTPSEYIQARG